MEFPENTRLTQLLWELNAEHYGISDIQHWVGKRCACGVVVEDGYWRIISKYIVRGDVCGGV